MGDPRVALVSVWDHSARRINGKGKEKVFISLSLLKCLPYNFRRSLLLWPACLLLPLNITFGDPTRKCRRESGTATRTTNGEQALRMSPARVTDVSQMTLKPEPCRRRRVLSVQWGSSLLSTQDLCGVCPNNSTNLRALHKLVCDASSPPGPSVCFLLVTNPGTFACS